MEKSQGSRTKYIAAAVIIVILVVVGVAAYVVRIQPTTTSTTMSSSSMSPVMSSSTSSAASAPATLSITFANVPVADPAKGSDEASVAALVNLYDSLVFPTSAGTLQPDLATSWQISSDGLTYTFTIRQGVTFHNGDPLTASDVVFSMKRMITIGQGFSYLFSPYIGNVTAPNSSTVVIVLKKPFGPFLTALVRLYVLDQKQVMANMGSGAYGSYGDYGSTWLLTHDAGSGAYSIQSANLEASMTFQEYTNYWNGTLPNQPTTVQIIGSTSSTQALFSSKDIQITDMWQPYSTIASVSQLPGAKMVIIPSVDEFYLMIDTKKAPTDDIYVREAMTYAFNYTAVINNIFTGSGQPAAGPVPVALPGHDPNIPVSHQDIALAKQLIAKSKYAGELSNYPVVYYWVSQVPAEQKMALQFASDMHEIGITVQVVQEPWLTVVADLANMTSSPNIVSIEDEASYFEAGSILQSRYTSAADGTWEQNEWLQNTTLDNMIYSALSTTDQTARFNAYYNIQEQIYDMYPTIYAFDAYELRAYYPSVVNWYAANGHPIVLLGYDFYFRDFQFYPSQLAALG